MISKLVIHLMKECSYPNITFGISFLCDMCWRLDKQEALFARVAKFDLRQSDAYTVCIILGLAEWENELNVSNEMHCICFLQQQSHAHTLTRVQMFVDIVIFNIWYESGQRLILVTGMLFGFAKNKLIPKVPIVLFKHHISNFGASQFLHSRKQCLLFIQASTHTTQKWY